jgi:hypothetical protein
MLPTHQTFRINKMNNFSGCIGFSGIPEINVDRFEPLYLPRLSLSKGHGPVTLSGNFYNILAHGPSNATATDAV